MTTPSGPAVIGQERRAERAAVPLQPPAERQPAAAASPAWMRFLPPLTTLGVMLIAIKEPSFWRDEAATLAAVQRPFGDLVRMLGNVDAVHGAYYMIMWVIARLAGTGELAMRLPSAIALAVGCLAVVGLGRRLISPRAGFAAGMLFAVLPAVTFYGQDARSYAMVTAMAAIVSYLLVRVLSAEPGRPRRRWLACYAAGMAALGILNIFALLLIAAHAVTVGLYCLGRRDKASVRRLALGWLAAAAAATLLVSPLLVLGWLQRGQISWLQVSANSGVGSVGRLIGPAAMTNAVLVVIALGVATSARAGRARLRAAWPGLLPEFCVPWLLLPAAILLAGSVITPVYTFRYILFCMPAAALLGGAGLAALGRIAGTVALVIVVLLGLQAQLGNRLPGGHGDNIRQADQIVAANMRPGDVVFYTNVSAESFGVAYPYGLAKLPNIAQQQAADPSGTLAGTDVSAAVLTQRLARVSRIWVVDINRWGPVPELSGLHFRRLFGWQTGDIWMELYAPVRTAP